MALVDEYRAETASFYKSMDKYLLLMWIDPNAIDSEVYIHMFRKTAEDFSDNISFAWIDATTPEAMENKKEQGLVSKSLPGVGFQLNDGRKIVFPENSAITVADLKMFCQEFLENKLNHQITHQDEMLSEMLEDRFGKTKKIVTK